MRVPFSLGIGGRLGDGRQFFPWIQLDDLVSVILWALDSPVEGARASHGDVAPVVAERRRSAECDARTVVVGVVVVLGCCFGFTRAFASP